MSNRVKLSHNLAAQFEDNGSLTFIIPCTPRGDSFFVFDPVAVNSLVEYFVASGKLGKEASKKVMQLEELLGAVLKLEAPFHGTGGVWVSPDIYEVLSKARKLSNE